MSQPPPQQRPPTPSSAEHADTEAPPTEVPSTGLAPPFRPLGPEPPGHGRARLPQVGERIGDFELLRELGRGSFARVYLARQISLDRQVALKISTQPGSEARTLANLEHDHIVRIFAESVDLEHQWRLLCMQYVPGPTLARLIGQLRERYPAVSWCGRVFLEALDATVTQAAMFDPAAARDRERLANGDFVHCVCWIGSRLAEALAHAHGQGVLHRDIKPANILLNPYGRPLLADFNLAHVPSRLRGANAELFGGTLDYMAPEHLDAFNREAGAPLEQVDERSDIYSLGVVLAELLTGRLPFAVRPEGPDLRAALPAMAGERRAGIPPLLPRPEGSTALAQVIGRCLEPEPERRYQSAAELARALEGCRELRQTAQALPSGGRLVQAMERRPFLWLGILALLPHVLGSIVNISYNALLVVTPEDRRAFAHITLGYNLLVYPVCVWLLGRLIGGVVRGWRELAGPSAPPGPRVTAFRRQVLRLPAGAAALSAIGWFPGALVFPLALDHLVGPMRGAVYGQFLMSFLLAGLVALTYSVLGVQFVVLRILYPRLWGDGQDLRQHAGKELAPLATRLWALQLLAGLIPLIAAALLVGTGSDQLPEASYQGFRLLVTGLIGLGTVGLVLAVSVSGFLSRTLVVLQKAAGQGG